MSRSARRRRSGRRPGRRWWSRAGGERTSLLTLAAVDEGICQVKNYKTPDPYGYFYAKEGPGDGNVRLLQTPASRAGQEQARSSTGGGEAEMGKRTNPLGVQRFKPVALWSGIVKTGASGEAQVSSGYSGIQRRSAPDGLRVQGGPVRFGRTAMKVADPVVVTPALPRFVSPGDSPVHADHGVQHHRQTARSCSLMWKRTGGLLLQASFRDA